MRLSLSVAQIILFLIVSSEINIIFLAPPSEAFVTIPAWLAFGAITAAVKLKLVLVKIMFALRSMGVGSIRIKRSAEMSSEQSETDELLGAWAELEATAEREIQFHLPSCFYGAMHGLTITENSPTPTTTMRTNKGRMPMHFTNGAEGDGYSKYVSSVIGTLTRDPVACQTLYDSISISSPSKISS